MVNFDKLFSIVCCNMISMFLATLKQLKKKDEKKIPHNKGISSTTFHKSKIIVSIGSENFESPQLMIKYAQNEFLEAFLFPRDRLSFFPFSLITGVSTPHEFLNLISVAVQTEKTANEYISLYRSNGTALSCHVSVMSITNRFIDTKLVPLDFPQTVDSTKWAVVTVNSAIITDPIHDKKGGESLETTLVNQGTLTEVKTARPKGKNKKISAAAIDQKVDDAQKDKNHNAVDMTEKQLHTIDCRSSSSSVLDDPHTLLSNQFR